MWSKIYAHSTKGAEAFDPIMHLFAQRPTIVTIAGDTFFVGLPALPTARDEVDALAGVTVLPSHVSPEPLSAKHVALLKKHGVADGDVPFIAMRKVRAKLGLPHHFDPHV